MLMLIAQHHLREVSMDNLFPNKPIELRDYQSQFVDDILAELQEKERIIASLPTGGGKTHVAMELIRRAHDQGMHVCFCVERLTLFAQARRVFDEHGITYDMVQGKNLKVSSLHPMCTIVTAQSLFPRAKGNSSNRSSKQRVLDRINLLIIDEAHICHSSMSKFFASYPKVKVVGLTATPSRKGLGNKHWYQSIVNGPSYRELIDRGVLVKPRYLTGNLQAAEYLKAELENVEVSLKGKGDYKEDTLSKLMQHKVLLGDAVDSYRKHAEGKKTLVFCVDIAHARAAADEFTHEISGISVASIDHRTPDEQRADIFQQFRSGKIQILCSVNMLTVGFDEPSAECVMLLRPTKSPELHIQQIGRGLRQSDGKGECIVLDLACNLQRHGIVESYDVKALFDAHLAKSKAAKDKVKLETKTCFVCYSEIPAKARTCPSCGSFQGKTSKVREVDAELVEYNAVTATSHKELRFALHANLGSERRLLEIGSYVKLWVNRQNAVRKANGKQPFKESYPVMALVNILSQSYKKQDYQQQKTIRGIASKIINHAPNVMVPNDELLYRYVGEFIKRSNQHYFRVQQYAKARESQHR
jgi:DNA repair protein RadD